MKVRNWHRTLLWAEYLFLFAGLIGIDYYIWISASATLSQAYVNWAFSETLEGREPSIRLFFRAEIDSVLGKHATAEAPAKVSEAPRPAEKPLPTATLEESALIGRIAIPRLGLNLVVREGVTEHTLRSAAGHIRFTALPGQPGKRDTLLGTFDVVGGQTISVTALANSAGTSMSGI